ncbi:MAG: DEAD/DEAH box helicase [Actinomycetota bacterium]|nr:DEAD/DEAH box helicase [Actinomycetota bacterium]
MAALESNRPTWIGALRRLIDQTDEGLRSVVKLRAEEREQIIADLAGERDRLAAALTALTGETVVPSVLAQPDIGRQMAATPVVEAPGVAQLQGSWADGRVIVWGGGPGVDPTDADGLKVLLGAADADAIAWERHADVPLPGGGKAEARSAPIAQTLGWLVGIGAGQVSAPVAPSLRWLGDVAVWGAELVAQGRMVPVLRGSNGTSSHGGGQARHRVRWVPALAGRDRFAALVARMPGAVVAVQAAPQADGACRAVLSAVVDAVSRAGAERVPSPAALATPTSRVEVSEAVLAGLDGRSFSAEADVASRLADALKRWAAPVSTAPRIGLTVRLDPPATDGGWLLHVEATGVDKAPLPVEHAMVVASGTKSGQVEAQLRRLERLLPLLRRPSTRRGQVVLDGDEASDLMFTTGATLAAAGFEVYLPLVSKRRPSPQLRLFAEAIGGQSQVGVAQLSSVRWSVLFGDLELDAAGIAKLAAEAKPLIQVKGRWVHLDRADLVAAAAALAERSALTELSGAELIRHAVGLEGGALGGPVRIDGSGWAVDLLHDATSNPPAPIEAPRGFKGTLRHYQAEAAGWLDFLDRASLGGCLAMDMGLGKTPTVLAHILATRGDGPALVVCPPAVLGNWAAETARFTPSLRVVSHHGPRRAGPARLAELAATADVVLTTYATAVRDIDALADIAWRRIVVDEAQVIKNHNSETAQVLRRLPARSRLALTGTPVENGLGDLWAILDFTNPGLVGTRTTFIESLSRTAEAKPATSDPDRAVGSDVRLADPKAASHEGALRALNGLLIFRRTKVEPDIAAELPDKVDKLDHCAMTTEQIGLYQAVVNRLIDSGLEADATQRKGQVLAAITALKQICDHPAAYLGADDTDTTLVGRSGKLTRLEEIVGDVFAAGERILVFTHFARWGEKLATHLTAHTGIPVGCYHGGLSRSTRDDLVDQFQHGTGPGALVLSIKAGGSGLNLTAANHVVLYDRWWNPAVEDQARDRAWRIGQTATVMSHRLVCPGTVDERVEEIVNGKRQVAGMVLPARSSLGDLDAEQIRVALGLHAEEVIDDDTPADTTDEEAA